MTALQIGLAAGLAIIVVVALIVSIPWRRS